MKRILGFFILPLTCACVLNVAYLSPSLFIPFLPFSCLFFCKFAYSIVLSLLPPTDCRAAFLSSLPPFSLPLIRVMVLEGELGTLVAMLAEILPKTEDVSRNSPLSLVHSI